MRKSYKRCTSPVLVTLVAILATTALPFLSAARSTPVASLTITNNSSRTVAHVYYSHVNADDWSADKLSGTPILPSQSAAIDNFSWDQSQIKIVAEDQEGCFLYGVVAIDNGSAAWTISPDASADCGN